MIQEHSILYAEFGGCAKLIYIFRSLRKIVNNIMKNVEQSYVLFHLSTIFLLFFIEKFMKKLVKVNMIFMANLINLKNKLMKKIVDVSKLYHLFLLLLPNR